MSAPVRHHARAAPKARTGFLGDVRGAAAAEFVLWISLLAFPVLSAVDIGTYIFQRMQVEMAAQAAVQAAWHACNASSLLPATQKCSGLLTSMTNAAQGTTLGTAVTVVSGSPSEGYYCLDSSNALALVGTAGTIGAPPTQPAPFDCHTKIAGSATLPGDYIKFQVSFVYKPVFSVSLGSALTTPITRTAWMRLN